MTELAGVGYICVERIGDIAWERAVNVADEARVVKVFVSSPIDVTPERGRAQAVVARLNRDYEGTCTRPRTLLQAMFAHGIHWRAKRGGLILARCRSN
jgi:hypothetical protein